MNTIKHDSVVYSLFPRPCSSIIDTAMGKLTLNPNKKDAVPIIARLVSTTGLRPTTSDRAPQNKL